MHVVFSRFLDLVQGVSFIKIVLFLGTQRFCLIAAGYRMMCVTNAPLCRRVTMRHCLALLGLTTLLPACGVTTWWLALDSLPLNLWQAYLGYQFYKDSDTRSARKLFRFSLLYLPILMLMILLHKKPRTEREEGMSQVAT